MFQVSKKFLVFTRIIVATCILFVILLTCFEAIALSRYSTDYLHGADLQLERSQALTKSALVLEYRPTNEHPQAISDMQIILPLFMQEQDLLSHNPNADVQGKVQEAHPDYQSIVTAIQKITAQPDKPVDHVQVDILLLHNRDFLNTEVQVTTLLQDHAQSQQGGLFFVEFVLDLLLLFLGGGFLVLFEITLKKQH